MLQSGALAAEDMRWLWGPRLFALIHWGTVIMCSNSSKALAPAFKQNVISELSYAHPLLCREMFIPREQQQNPGCQDEMK